MSRHDNRVVWQSEHRIVQRADDLLHVTTRKIGSANRAREQRIARDQLLLCREMQTDAAFRMPGGVQHLGHKWSRLDRLSSRDTAIDLHFTRSGNSYPGRLQVQHLEQSIVILVE